LSSSWLALLEMPGEGTARTLAATERLLRTWDALDPPGWAEFRASLAGVDSRDDLRAELDHLIVAHALARWGLRVSEFVPPTGTHRADLRVGLRSEPEAKGVLVEITSSQPDTLAARADALLSETLTMIARIPSGLRIDLTPTAGWEALVPTASQVRVLAERVTIQLLRALHARRSDGQKAPWPLGWFEHPIELVPASPAQPFAVHALSYDPSAAEYTRVGNSLHFNDVVFEAGDSIVADLERAGVALSKLPGPRLRRRIDEERSHFGEERGVILVDIHPWSSRFDYRAYEGRLFAERLAADQNRRPRERRPLAVGAFVGMPLTACGALESRQRLWIDEEWSETPLGGSFRTVWLEGRYHPLENRGTAAQRLVRR
jgi:hypothetical protein